MARLLLAVAVVAVFSAPACNRSPGPWDLRIATATEGGTYKAIGDDFAIRLKKFHPDTFGKVEVLETQGSPENLRLLALQRDLPRAADLALVMRPEIELRRQTAPGSLDGLTILARLYRDVLHLVARDGTEIRSLADLRGRRVYIGCASSGTRTVVTMVLEAAGVDPGSLAVRPRDDSHVNYDQAAKMLLAGELDAAFFVAGTPVRAVATLLDSKRCRLVPIDSEGLLASEEGSRCGLEASEIPAATYGDLPAETLPTPGSRVYLVGRRDLDPELVSIVLDVLFENMVEMLSHRTMAGIRQDDAFEGLTDALEVHPGVHLFREREAERLLIATGAARGQNYAFGRRLQKLLEARGTRTRVRSTDGSIENLGLLGNGRSLAVVHYDIALAACFDDWEAIYGIPGGADLPDLRNLCSVATLHPAKAHVILRQGALGEPGKDGAEAKPATLGDLRRHLEGNPGAKLRICVGAAKSGTAILARSILQHHKFDASRMSIRHYPAEEMAKRLIDGTVDLGFFVSYTPSRALSVLLDSDKVRLLSLDDAARARLVRHGVFEAATIDCTNYTCLKGAEKIQTIATRSILATVDDVDADVAEVCRAMTRGEMFLGVTGGMKTLATPLSSLPFHPDAREVYEDLKLLPRGKTLLDYLGDPFTATWQTLAILVTLAGGYRGLRAIRYRIAADRIGWRVLAIPIEAGTPGAVGRLRDMGRLIRDAVNGRWWHRGSIDWRRWRILHDLIEERIHMARDSMFRSLVQEIHTVGRMPPEERTVELERLETRTKVRFAEGELDPDQRSRLLGLIEDAKP